MTTVTITDQVVTATVTDNAINATIADQVVTATVSGGLLAASESSAGALQLATAAEAAALTATDRAIVPSVFYSAYAASHGGHIDVTKSHGIATGTGSDQTTALDAAIDSITSNGDIAYIPGGAVIRVDEGLVPAANARIEGGPGATLQSTATGVGTYMFEPAGANGVHIRGVKFLGILGVDADNSTDTAIFNQTASADDWVIEYCEFDSFWARALRSNGVDMTRFQFNHNYVHDIYNLGLDLSHLVDGVVAYNHFDTCGNASGDWAMYASNPAAGILVEGNRITNCWAGIKVLNSSDKARILGNSIETTGGDCITIASSSGFTVANNDCYPAAVRPGIVTETATVNALIANNRIDLGGNQAVGIQIEVMTDGVVTGNQIRNGDITNAATHGISLFDCTNVIVSDNHILDVHKGVAFTTGNTFTRTHVVGNAIHTGGSGTTGIFGSGITSLVASAIRNNTFTNSDINIDFGSNTLTNVTITDNHAPTGVAGSRFMRASGMVGGVVANNIGNQSMQNFALGSLGTAVVFGNKSTSDGAFVTFTNNDATPAVDLGDSFICSHSGSTNITDFDSGFDGRTITIHFTTANSTLIDGTNIMLNGSTNYTPPAGTIMQFQQRSNIWYELSRVNT